MNIGRSRRHGSGASVGVGKGVQSAEAKTPKASRSKTPKASSGVVNEEGFSLPTDWGIWGMS